MTYLNGKIVIEVLQTLLREVCSFYIIILIYGGGVIVYAYKN